MSPKGFTLIEILIGIAIIGILSAVAIPQYNKYKIRGYDAHSKQALRDMHTLCNAYWLENNSSDGCELSLIKNITYGFNQNPEIVATLPPSPLDNFCASAKHNSSPNTYSIDSAAKIIDGEQCGGVVPVPILPIISPVLPPPVKDEPIIRLPILPIIRPVLPPPVTEPGKEEERLAALQARIEARPELIKECEETVHEYQNIQNKIYTSCYTGGRRSKNTCKARACSQAAYAVYNDRDAGRGICRNSQTYLEDDRGLDKFLASFNPQCPRHCGSTGSLSTFLMNQNRGNRAVQEAIRIGDYCRQQNISQRQDDFGLVTIEGTADNGYNTYTLSKTRYEDGKQLQALAKELREGIKDIGDSRSRDCYRVACPPTKAVDRREAATQAEKAIREFKKKYNRPNRFCISGSGNLASVDYIC